MPLNERYQQVLRNTESGTGLHSVGNYRQKPRLVFSGSYCSQNNDKMCNIIPIMARTGPPLLPRVSRLLRGYGENLKLARLRRRFSANTVAQRAAISRKTLSRVEKGDSAVALGIYARVMQVLRLEEDLAKLAVDDPLGRKLQDSGLAPKRRAPKRRSSPTASLDHENKPKEAL